MGTWFGGPPKNSTPINSPCSFNAGDTNFIVGSMICCRKKDVSLNPEADVAKGTPIHVIKKSYPRQEQFRGSCNTI